MKTNSIKKYSRKLVMNILEHLYENDYFYHKKCAWEDWIIAKVDIEKVVDQLSKEQQRKVKLFDMEDPLFYLIYNRVNGL